ncbi:MAG: hypothetical protein HN353_07160 [Bdellovibrionales bacterium]|nr:hypothetical protein [Bdellovibrionales bacterium]MBT3526588.1 hypothetical protein [Bdellovibrionales bacterium]MBT7670321.1 hypothetical protein [Bdellovibrionales bacterium]MBT7768229.1 hypothetical protein [Bdellovibrionales bacterium]
MQLRLLLLTIFIMIVGSLASYYLLIEEDSLLTIAQSDLLIEPTATVGNSYQERQLNYKNILKSEKFKDALNRVVAKSRNSSEELSMEQLISTAEGHLDRADRSALELELAMVFDGSKPYDKMLERMIIASAYYDSIPDLQSMVSSYIVELHKKPTIAFDNIEDALLDLSLDNFPQDRADFIKIATALPGMKARGARLAMQELKRFNYPALTSEVDHLTSQERELLFSTDLQMLSLLDTFSVYLENSSQTDDKVFNQAVELIISQQNQQLREKFAGQYSYHYPKWRERLEQALMTQKQYAREMPNNDGKRL